MKFLEYIIMFSKLKRDNDIQFMVSEDNYHEYKIGDIVIISDFNHNCIDDNIFVIIEENNVGIPINYLYFLSNKEKNVDFVYQLDDKKIQRKIGKISSSVISEYKRKFILLNRSCKV